MTADLQATSAPPNGGLGDQEAPAVGRWLSWRLPFSPWHLVLVPLSFLLLVPLLWIVITSLETEGEANHFPPVLVPAHPRFANYADAWAAAPFCQFFLNSALVTLVVRL